MTSAETLSPNEVTGKETGAQPRLSNFPKVVKLEDGRSMLELMKSGASPNPALDACSCTNKYKQQSLFENFLELPWEGKQK